MFEINVIDCSREVEFLGIIPFVVLNSGTSGEDLLAIWQFIVTIIEVYYSDNILNNKLNRPNDVHCNLR